MDWDDPPQTMINRLRDKSLVIQHPERERIAAELERLRAAAGKFVDEQTAENAQDLRRVLEQKA